MKIYNIKNISELIEIATRTTIPEEIEYLSKNPSMNVRRAIARNRSTSKEVLERLVCDPVQNVAYMASVNPNNMFKKDFDDLSVCSLCEKDERSLNCISCVEVKKHSF